MRVLDTEINELYPEVVRIRRALHQIPELSGREIETRRFLCELLDREGIPWRQLPSGGLVAVIGSSDTALGIRADMDALPIAEETGLPYASQNPGCMHACGHDLHMAATMGAAMYLKRHEAELPQAVTLLFQPNEELTGGADDMIKEGCMEHPAITKVIGFHVDPTSPTGMVSLRPGAINAALYDIYITVTGKSCHGAHPDEGVDAIAAACAIVTAIQSVPSRSFAASTPVIVTIGTIQGGSSTNIIASEVTLTGTLRALEQSTLDLLRDRIETVCRETAAAYGASVSFSYPCYYPPLISDPALTQHLEALAREHFGSEMVAQLPTPSLGGDDFAFFSSQVPGFYFNVGTRAADQGDDQCLHHSRFAPDEEALKTAMTLLCLAV